MIQNLIVALVVAAAFCHVCAKYLPAALKRRLVYLLTRGGAGRQSKLVRWLDAGSSCASGCDTCGSCAPTPPAGAHAPARRVIRLHVQK